MPTSASMRAKKGRMLILHFPWLKKPVGAELQVSRQDLKLVQHFGEKGEIDTF